MLNALPAPPARPAAGIRTPLPVAHMAETFPEAYADLVHNTTTLEKHMHDMQDCE